MYAIVWQITQDGDLFVATAVRTGTYDGRTFFNNATTTHDPVSAPTLEALRSRLKAPPCNVLDRLKTPPTPPVIEEWI